MDLNERTSVTWHTVGVVWETYLPFDSYSFLSHCINEQTKAKQWFASLTFGLCFASKWQSGVEVLKVTVALKKCMGQFELNVDALLV